MGGIDNIPSNMLESVVDPINYAVDSSQGISSENSLDKMPMQTHKISDLTADMEMGN